MLDPTLQSRFEGLIKVHMAERQKQFPLELRQIDSQAASHGRLNSGVHILQSKQAHERELEIRTILAWNSLVRVHRTFGCPMPDSLRNDFKAEMRQRIDEIFAELSGSLEERTRKSGLNIPVSLTEPHRDVLAKHDIEVDLYVDSLSISSPEQGTHPMTHNYNFYGAVGSVQTGANAVANAVQNLGADDRTALSTALQQVRDALSSAPTVGEQQRRELLEITEECASQMAMESPNNTKLLTMFNVLGTTIQSIAGAQPAYQALKVAVLPLGITLP